MEEKKKEIIKETIKKKDEDFNIKSIKDLEDKLNIEISKNEKLNKEYNDLKQKYYEQDKIINIRKLTILNLNEEINKIKKLDILYKEALAQNKILIEENKKMNNETSSIKKNSNHKILNYEELVTLYKKIEELREKLDRYPIELLKGEKLISVIFSSVDEKVQHSIICKNTETLSRLIEELYKIYPDYSKIQTCFISKGKMVDIFKSLEMNNIHNSDIIILKTIEKN